MSGNSQKSRLKDLIARGKEQGYLTYAEVNDHLPEDIADPDQVEDIIRMINDMGIQVSEVAPDADTLLSEACPALIDVQAWQATKERTKMNAELKAHWDDVVQGSGIV